MMIPPEHSMPFEDLIPLLSAARRQARLLPPSHPSVVRAVRDLLERITFGLLRATSVTISILGSEIYLDGRLLANESIACADVVRELTERKLDSMVFLQGLTLEELVRFIALTNLRPDEIEARGGWKPILEQKLIRHINTNRVAGLEETAAELNINVRVAKETHQICLDSVISSFNEVREGGHFDFSTIQQRVKMFTALLLNDQQVFHNLSTIKDKDQYTFYHSINVAVLSLLIGFRLNLPPPLLELVGAAAMLHDIGKMSIPLEILNKPDDLDDRELDIMQTHSVEGAKILLQVPDLQALPMVVAAQHHAEHSLGGYPSFPRLGRLHMLTEIVAVADVFDALTSDRPYRSAMLPDQAMRIMATGSGDRFHPVLVKVFAQLSGLYPIGTLVELDTGELGVVVRPNPDDLCRPEVKIFKSTPGTHAPTSEVRLSEKNSGNEYKRSIVRSIDPAKYELQIPSLVMASAPGNGTE